MQHKIGSDSHEVENQALATKGDGKQLEKIAFRGAVLKIR